MIIYPPVIASNPHFNIRQIILKRTHLSACLNPPISLGWQFQKKFTESRKIKFLNFASGFISSYGKWTCWIPFTWNVICKNIKWLYWLIDQKRYLWLNRYLSDTIITLLRISDYFNNLKAKEIDTTSSKKSCKQNEEWKKEKKERSR